MGCVIIELTARSVVFFATSDAVSRTRGCARGARDVQRHLVPEVGI